VREEVRMVVGSVVSVRGGGVKRVRVGGRVGDCRCRLVRGSWGDVGWLELESSVVGGGGVVLILVE